MNEPFQYSNESFLHIEKWQKINPSLKAGFTTRKGGISKSPYHSLNFGFHVDDLAADVLENRKILAQKLEIPLKDWVTGEQVHHTEIKVIDDRDRGKGSLTNLDALKGIDGLITNKKGVLCTAFFADCVPLFFYDPVTSYIGIAHAGWKGSVNRMAEKMVARFQALGVNISDLLVTIGPCISMEQYEVDEVVASHIDYKLRGKVLIEKDNNRYLLNLKQLNVEILLQTGILRHNIDVTNYCTYNDKDIFFSHRRDKGRTGRMLGFLGYIDS
ncbi:peptidoglycan editing factor PgeF [Oceanobacillus piezotolerans]|uniref:Purine nucleoside phosphorylase n=1 Tax=Oceanobacillus piezotolerans TaxID=2448030 RepID=A0A498DIB9_9BACI|nr:peptidoglycan editing factor PgeF [Oceanobacillus piezotolerans]RLL45245.1 peptidoglycan editing factor PgeF [Oceanobacillus piezotolerans]